VTFDTKWCKFGLGICYDVRFPLQALIYRQRGCKVLVYPAAFNPTTGPVHFEKLAVARALDTQSFFVFSAPARNVEDRSVYQSYGNSMVVNPNGCVVTRAELGEGNLYWDVDLGEVDRQRSSFPFEEQMRRDLAELRDLGVEEEV
jgi:omega-amidase